MDLNQLKKYLIEQLGEEIKSVTGENFIDALEEDGANFDFQIGHRKISIQMKCKGYGEYEEEYKII